jgi:hypothetical protein
MKQAGLRIALAIVLVFAGWAIGHAQLATPDFEITIDAPVGETTVTCVRGCGLAWVQRGVPSASAALFKYSCTGNTVTRCGSGRVGGWIRPDGN